MKKLNLEIQEHANYNGLCSLYCKYLKTYIPVYPYFEDFDDSPDTPWCILFDASLDTCEDKYHIESCEACDNIKNYIDMRRKYNTDEDLTNTEK